jgi:hypothetical protein
MKKMLALFALGLHERQTRHHNNVQTKSFSVECSVPFTFQHSLRSAMARTKANARKSTDGAAPRKAVSTRGKGGGKSKAKKSLVGKVLLTTSLGEVYGEGEYVGNVKVRLFFIYLSCLLFLTVFIAQICANCHNDLPLIGELEDSENYHTCCQCKQHHLCMPCIVVDTRVEPKGLYTCKRCCIASNSVYPVSDY